MLKTNEIQELCVEIQNLASRIEGDLTSTLVNLSGSLKDIECGTHIKIPTGAGYVNFYKSVGDIKISCWICQSLNNNYKSEQL